MPPDKHGNDQHGNLAAANTLLQLRRRLQLCDSLLHPLLVSQQLEPRELLLLWVCQRQGNRFSSQHEIARFLGVSPALVSGLADRLRRRGLLVGVRGPHDRRRQQWNVSPEGNDALQHSMATVETRLAALKQGSQLELFAELDRLLEQVQALWPVSEEPLKVKDNCRARQGDAPGSEAA